MGLQLVILAAGVGRRFGGLKQLTPVGPGGETIMDYTVFDALRHGFDQVVVVTRSEIHQTMAAHVQQGFGRHVATTFVHQKISAVPDGYSVPENRVKPWGTSQAVLAAAPVINGSFAVANADDYYGEPALAALGAFLAVPPTTPPTWAMIGFNVADTLPSEGSVSRGLVRAGNGYLESIEEVHTVRRHPDGAVWDAPEGPRVIPGSTPVSMNLWGFGPEALTDLDHRFRIFLAGGPGGEEECYLPVCVGDAVKEKIARVAVLPAASHWCGMTSAADLPVVKATLAKLVDRGIYPERLWV